MSRDFTGGGIRTGMHVPDIKNKDGIRRQNPDLTGICVLGMPRPWEHDRP